MFTGRRNERTFEADQTGRICVYPSLDAAAKRDGKEGREMPQRVIAALRRIFASAKQL